MKAKLFAYISVALIALLLVISCDPKATEPKETTYSTPTIKGTVSIPEGGNISPSEIYVKVIDEEGKTATIQKASSDGTFAIQNLKERMRYSILFTSVEPEQTNRDLSRGPESTSGVGGWLKDVVPTVVTGNDIGSVKLKPLGTIKGRALKEGETEHFDITVYIPGTSYIAMTDEEGNFSIYNVPEGDYNLRYVLDDHLAQTKAVSLVCPDGEENPEVAAGEVTLRSDKGSVVGRVAFDGENDHAGINILLESEDKSISMNGLTSEDGTFVIGDVKPGKYRILVTSSGYLPVYSSFFYVEAATTVTVPEQIILFKNVGTIQGSVILSEERSDYSGISISIVGNGTSYSTVTSQDGSFVKIVKPGTYTVTASYPGYTSQSVEITVSENSTSTLSFPPLPLSSGAVAGFVILSGGEDYSGVVVTLTNSSAATESYTAVSAFDGSFRLTGLNKGGTYLLTYSKDGYVSENTKSIDVTVGSIANAGTVTLRSTYATVKGVVQLEGASSHENITVLLRNDSNQYTATTDQKGECLINRVLPGTYTLLASKDGYVTSTPLEVVVEPSSEKTIETRTLSVAIRSITGRVTLELLSDYSGALVTATNLSDNTLVYSAITNSEGNFTLAGMIPGEYSVVISCNGYRTVTLPTINIVSSSTTDLPEKNMLINRGTVSGTANLEGRSSSEGIIAELMRGSEVYESTTTDESGNYSFYVPQGNYSGVRYSKTDFASSSVSRSIALFADNYVSMGDTELKATHNTVSGKVDVLTTDNEGDVTISFDGMESITAYTTTEDGEFSFEHVPVGKCVMRFRRTDCSDITVPVNVTAADVISLGTVTITPNSATIKGTVVLKEGLSSEGVTVSIDMGGKTLQTTTDTSGRYEIGGVSTAEEYTVNYSKNGWNTDTQSISPKLNPLEVRELPEITLVDTTAPVVNHFVINEGSSFTDSPILQLRIYSRDEGSSLDCYALQIKKIVDGIETDVFPSNYLWKTYDQNVVFDLAELPNTVYTGNGEYKLFVTTKDRAGNISTSFEKEIVITNNATSLTGQLRGENLHLTKERSPYVVESNCTVGPEDTLVIDPGCEIRFTGNYSIYVAGEIIADGSDNEKIVFTKDDSSDVNWKTLAILGPDAVINNLVDYEEGSIIRNCDFYGAEIPLSLSSRVFVDKCNFSDSGCIKVTSNPVIINSTLGNGINIDNSGHGIAVLINNLIEESLTYGYTNLVHCEYNTFKDTNILMTTGYYRLGWVFNHNKLIKSTMKFEQYLNTESCSLNYNSFNECEGVFINYNLSSHDYDVVDYSNNYWGAARTEEIEAKGTFSDLSFIYDWFDNPDQPRVDYSNWLEEEPEVVGYQGDSFDWDIIKNSEDIE